MIDRYSDHASNERTLLAWVRTGIAFIAFGFVLEKFHVVIKSFMAVTPGAQTDLHLSDTGHSSLVLVVFGLATIVISLVRFVHTTKNINSPNTIVYTPWPAVAIGAVFFALGCIILFKMMGV